MAVAFWQLRFAASLSSQAAYFWLLCLVLGGGLAGVALLTAVGSSTERFAITRLAFARKENDLFEAVRESYEIREQCQALRQLVQEASANRQPVANDIVLDSLHLIISRDSHRYEIRELEARWKAIGASDILVNLLRRSRDTLEEDDERNRYKQAPA
jgi:hypothetical protein